jgi:hypothetical protein
MAVRKLFVAEALVSIRRLNRITDELTIEEVMACLNLESASRRRQSVTDKLISQAVRLESQSLLERLQEKHHGKST